MLDIDLEAPYENCSTCGYWIKAEPDTYSDRLEMGQCHIRAPDGAKAWPVTRKDDWCGEWDQAVRPDFELLRKLIPEKVIEDHPFLMRPLQISFVMRHRYKIFWPAAWHLLHQSVMQIRKGRQIASVDSSLMWIANRRLHWTSTKPFTPKTDTDHQMVAECRWILDNQHVIFPTIFKNLTEGEE